jgi:hypothetical protein
MSEGEKAGAAWACEMIAIGEAERRLPPGSSLRVDFDNFLASPAEGLAEIAGFFGSPIEREQADRLASGPLMRRYSKALEHEYSPQLRNEVLAESRRTNRAAIAAALDWIDAAAKVHPALADWRDRRD